jgi:hypothetical protein
MMVDIASSAWHQIVVRDPQALSGASVGSFISSIVRKMGATIIVASDLVGAYHGLKGHEQRLLASDDFLTKVKDATQYDWAFFFLYSRTPTAEELQVADDKAAMLIADVTVRLVDDQYFYVYSRDESLMSKMQRMYPGAEHKTSIFGELDVPY